MRKIEQVETAIVAGLWCIKDDEDDFLMHHRILEEQRRYKKKKMRSRTERSKNRITTPIFEEKEYKLDVYSYYKEKAEYTKHEFCSYFTELGLEPRSTTQRVLNANLELIEFKLRTYEDYLKEE